MKKIKLTAVFGTRPEAIKMCPLILELQRRDNFDTRLCLTGQHGDMVRSVTDHFGVTPDADLQIMSEGQTLFDITERVLCRFKRELEANSPDVVLVHGDTSSAFAAASSGTVTRTISQPASASSRICASVAAASRVSVLVID